MGLFESKEEKEQRKQFKAQLDAQRESNESNVLMDLSGKSLSVYEPQVSSEILRSERLFLPWQRNSERNCLVLPKKYADLGLLEPFGVDDSKSFLDSEGQKLLLENEDNLQDIFRVGEKYGWDNATVRLFNSFVLNRWSLLGVSRTSGNSVKAAKTMNISSSSSIKRGVDDKKQDKFLGLF